MANGVTEIMERALDLNWIRQQLISNNIANVDTPGYKRVDVDFKSSLIKALNNHDNNSKSRLNAHDLEPVFVESEELTLSNDGNNVDIEKEMSQQAVNLLQYALLTRLVSDQLGMLRTAITEGRR
jgi:flagellar basal-body rod protein FlgB